FSRGKLLWFDSSGLGFRSGPLRNGGVPCSRAGLEVVAEPAQICVEDSRVRLGVGRLASRRATYPAWLPRRKLPYVSVGFVPRV
ncbi:unnamed protein product, partial [Arabidopsis halleri]